jgi:DHA1 family bicyclomycin/chloramphenicol resistance-like MFS transporter
MAHNSTNNKLITYLVSFAAFFGPFTQSIYTPLLPQVRQQFNTSEYVVNLTISIFTFVMAFMQIVYGPLTDNVGRRKVLLPGIILYIIASAGAALSYSISLLLLFRVLQATGIAVGSVVATTVIGDVFEGKSRGRAMGTFQMLVALGPAVGPVVGGFVGQYFGFHGVFWVLTITGLLLLLLNSIYLPETRPAHFTSRKFNIREYVTILANRNGLAVILLGFFQYFTFYNFLVFLPALLVLFYHLSPAQNGLVFLPLSLSVVIGSLVGGRTQEHYEPKRFLITAATLNVIATLLFALVVASGFPFLLISLSFFGLCLGVSLPVQTTLLANTFHHNRATAMGLYNFFRFMGMAAGPMVGTVFYHMGNRVEFVAAALFFGVAVVFAASWFFRVRVA